MHIQSRGALKCYPHDFIFSNEWSCISSVYIKVFSTFEDILIISMFLCCIICSGGTTGSLQGMYRIISAFCGVRTRLKFNVSPSRLCLEQNNTFLTCSNPSQCDILSSTSLSVSLFLSTTTYNATKNKES